MKLCSRTADTSGFWRPLEPSLVRAELIGCCAPGRHCALMPNGARSISAYRCADRHDHSLSVVFHSEHPANRLIRLRSQIAVYVLPDAAECQRPPSPYSSILHLLGFLCRPGRAEEGPVGGCSASTTGS